MTVRDRVLRVVSPRHRRWAGILRSCTLATEQMPRPVPPPGPRDVVVCGSPRTGTALATAALWAPPGSVAVMEPWDALRLPPAELFASLRQEMTSTGRLGRGRLDVHALRERGAVEWVGDGGCPVEVRLDPDAVVAVKYPGFWRYLDLLPTTRFVVCLRDPVETIRSFRTTGGRLGDGLQYDVPFEATLNARLRAEHADPSARRVALYDEINERLLPHLDRPEVHVLRYERWFEEPDAVLAELGAFVGADLSDAAPRIRPRRPVPDDDEARTIRRLCRTAERLGYPS